MACVTRRIDYESRADVYRVWLLSDLHLGSAYCDEKLLRRTVAEIAANPCALWLGLGDYAEWINRRDPRALESERAKWLWGVDDLAQRQIEYLCDVLGPIRGQCIGLVPGNHEYSIMDHSERDVYGRLAEALMGPDQRLKLGPNGFVELQFARTPGERRTRGNVWTCDIYATHGCAGGRKVGGKAARLEDIYSAVEADVVCMGHTHTPLAFPRIRRAASHSTGTITARECHLVNAGSLLGGIDTGWPEYAERKDYAPNPACVVGFDVVPNERTIRVFGA